MKRVMIATVENREEQRYRSPRRRMDEAGGPHHYCPVDLLPDSLLPIFGCVIPFPQPAEGRDVLPSSSSFCTNIEKLILRTLGAILNLSKRYRVTK